MSPARIAPLEPPYDEPTAAMLARWMPPGSAVEPLALFRLLQRHGELASRMRPLGAGILAHGLVDPPLRELVIHRTCALCGAEYEWGIHAVAFGAPLGLRPEQLAATVAGDLSEALWSHEQRLVLELAEELHHTSRISEELFLRLRERFGEPELIELAVTAGWYHVIAYVIGLAALPGEPWAARFPAQASSGAATSEA